MKYKKYFPFAAIVLALGLGSYYWFSGSSSHKKTTYQITDWMAAMPVNLKTYDGGLGWAKMVIYHDSIRKDWKLNSNGDTVWNSKIASDTFWYLRSPDKDRPYLDSLNKPVIDPSSKQPIYFLSWDYPIVADKVFVKGIILIPPQILPQLYRSIPQSLTELKKIKDSLALKAPPLNIDSIKAKVRDSLTNSIHHK